MTRQTRANPLKLPRAAHNAIVVLNVQSLFLSLFFNRSALRRFEGHYWDILNMTVVNPEPDENTQDIISPYLEEASACEEHSTLIQQTESDCMSASESGLNGE